MLLLMLLHRGDNFLLNQSADRLMSRCVDWCYKVEQYGLAILVSFSTFEKKKKDSYSHHKVNLHAGKNQMRVSE